MTRRSKGVSLAALASALIALSACGGTAAPTPPANRAPVVPVADEPGALNIGALPGQALDPGECGFFLFSQRAPVQFVFFSSNLDQSALMVLDEVETALTLQDGAGAAIAGQFADQTFVAPGVEVRVTVAAGEELTNGQRLEDGRLRVRHETGWSVVIPVGGLAACQP